MIDRIRKKAIQVCFFSYRLRDLVFCESPALISLVAFDLALRTYQPSADSPATCKFTSARQMAEETLQENEIKRYGATPEEREALWQKVNAVKGKIEKLYTENEKTKKLVKKILAKFNNDWWNPTGANQL